MSEVRKMASSTIDQTNKLFFVNVSSVDFRIRLSDSLRLHTVIGRLIVEIW
jgi:hypothetical protein